MKPRIAKGTRDFLPTEVVQRRYIFNIIEKVFQKYGYLQIETPTMELLETLTGKYGEEGDRLLFKILNNGDYLAKANQQALEEKNSNALISSISKRGLRYDLTVPFARFVVMHQNDIQFPFKRYQIQPVWRADRPQKGRYNEFYQCDVDVVGSDSLMYEAELIQIYDEVFKALNLPVIIQVNNRKVLYGIAEAAGIEEQFVDMTVAIDKLDKIGKEGVTAELQRKEIGDEALDKIFACLDIDNLSDLEDAFANGPTGLEGIKELRAMHRFVDTVSLHNELKFDISLARGLNYYTGCIFEVKAIDADMGSIGGGGRYDDLTGVFGLKNVSGVGISFGAERIYDVMQEKGLFPKSLETQMQLIVVALDEQSHLYGFGVVDQLRKAGIESDLYPAPVKMNKQMKYANARKIPFVVVIGESERASGQLALKDMESGTQSMHTIDELISKFTK